MGGESVYHNLVLDFTGIYSEVEAEKEKLTYIDCKDILETDMYCSKEAEYEIKQRIEKFGPYGIHFLDSGNYHYVTKLFVEQIKAPFSLVLFDYHDDMRKRAVHEMTDCGSWAREIILNHPYLKQLIIIGPDQKQLENADIHIEKKLICISIQELESEKAEKKLKQIENNVPFYISIDKDVMSESCAVTNWNQGRMSLTMLEDVLTLFIISGDVIGVDICGEYPLSTGNLSDYNRAEKINKETNKALFQYIRSFIQ